MECKCSSALVGNSKVIELIDTLWNVNDFLKYVQKEFDKRINRYIMECKYWRT